MALRAFKHTNATRLQDAVSTLSKNGEKAVLIAGGTDLLGIMRDSVHSTYPELLVNVKTIPGMDYVKEDETGLKIGALTTLRDIEDNEVVKNKYPLLAEAAHSVASPQLRNTATIGGNLCQEPRCWYYRYHDDGFPCIRKGGKNCNALTGENQYHSIFGAVRVTASPCSTGCPGGIDIPSYMAKIREGKVSEAAQILVDSNPLPALTGRVCPHFCESDCNRNYLDETVSIRSVERYLGDYVLEHYMEYYSPPAVENKKTVAIVGSGPAGLSAAYFLRREGYAVTIFEKKKETGGMFAYGIPVFRLPREVLRQQIDALKFMGIKFEVEANIGPETGLAKLRRDFDFVFLSTGSWVQKQLGLEHQELLVPGMELLTKVTEGLRKSPGKRVLVIGGGNVAVDVSTTIHRLGAESVTMVCLEDRNEMPAIPHDLEQALTEGVKLINSWGPHKILTENGVVKGMEFVKCTSVFDSERRFNPTFDNNVKTVIEADQIVLAITMRPDLSFTDPSLNVERGLVVVDAKTQATNLPGVFAGGDVTLGAASVIQAIAAGHMAARSIVESVDGPKGISKRKKEETFRSIRNFETSYLNPVKREKAVEIPIPDRTMDKEDIAGLSLNQVQTEARRCFNCGCVAVSPSDVGTALVALDAKIKTNRRTVKAEAFFAAKPKKSTMLEDNELVTEIQVPAPKEDSRQTFIKFRTRSTIDFAIVSVASVMSLKAGKVTDSRVVLGAVAPSPLRAREVEEFLKGKKLTEETAKAASTLAVKDANPLLKNTYKVTITKSLVERALMGKKV